MTVLCPSIDTGIPEGDKQRISLLIKWFPGVVKTLLIRVIDDVSEQQQNLLETLWPNALILLQKRQRPRQETGRVQSDSRQVTKPGPGLRSPLLLRPGPPFLPRREWARGAPTLCPDHAADQESSPCLWTSHRVQKNRCAAQSRRGPFPPESVPQGHPRVGEAPEHGPSYWSHRPTGLGQSLSPLGKRWMAATISTPAFLQRCSNAGEKDRAEIHQKGEVVKETPTHWPASLEYDLGIRSWTWLR